MPGVAIIEVAKEESEIRLDRWFRRHFPDLGHGRLEKLLRTGQIRVDGHRAEAGARLAHGQKIRVPPLDPASPRPITPTVPPKEAARLREAILHMDDEVIVIDKPAGLAVQGGTGTVHHLDGLLEALRFDAPERPRLVHRLDRDTSGVLALARTARAAAHFAAAFRDRRTRKLYWAAVVGRPKPREGLIDQALIKRLGRAGERMVSDDEDGKPAITRYRTIAHAGDKIAWLALEPLTGRTHQLRAHCASLGTPILGDGKYGSEMPSGLALPRRLHLHARALSIPRADGSLLVVEAPLPPHMKETWSLLGFDERDDAAFL